MPAIRVIPPQEQEGERHERRVDEDEIGRKPVPIEIESPRKGKSPNSRQTG